MSTKATMNVQGFLDSVGVTKRVAEIRPRETIFRQGDPSTDILYIQNGRVKISVLNKAGKEAVLEILAPGNFFGEGCLARQPFRTATATAITFSTVLLIEKKEMIRALRVVHGLSHSFISYMLMRSVRLEESLVDQLFNSTEKRLARTLLLLAHYGKEGQPQKLLPKISQSILAEMVGTTRSRVNLFMNKFKKLGFIHYDGGLHVDSSLLRVVLNE